MATNPVLLARVLFDAFGKLRHPASKPNPILYETHAAPCDPSNTNCETTKNPYLVTVSYYLNLSFGNNQAQPPNTYFENPEKK